MDPAPSRRLHPVRFALAGLAALGCLLSAAPEAVAETLPGPPLDAASTPGAFCAPRGDAGLGATGFAGAVAAIALVARRRRDPL